MLDFGFLLNLASEFYTCFTCISVAIKDCIFTLAEAEILIQSDIFRSYIFLKTSWHHKSLDRKTIRDSTIMTTFYFNGRKAKYQKYVVVIFHSKNNELEIAVSFCITRWYMVTVGKLSSSKQCWLNIGTAAFSPDPANALSGLLACRKNMCKTIPDK